MRLWYIFLLMALMPAAFAVETTVQAELTLEQAIVNVLEHNPALKAADAHAKAAAVRIRSAKLSPAYQASLELENFAGGGRYGGTDALETTLSLAKVLELGNKSGLRGELAQHKAMLLQNENDAKRLDLLAKTTRYFIRVVSEQERVQIAKDSLTLAQKTLEVVTRRVSAGRSPNAELRRAKINLARKELELHHVEHSLASARVKLSTLWGATDDRYGRAQAGLFKFEPIMSFSSHAQLLERNPDLLRFATEERILASRIELAKSGSKPDIRLGGGLRHFNDSKDTAFIFSIDVPLGTSSRSGIRTEEIDLLARRNPYLHEQRRLELHALLFEIHQEVKHAMDMVTTLRDLIIPEAQLALKEYEKGYAAGRYSFVELTEAQRALLDARMEAVAAAMEYHNHQIELDRLTGAGLITGVKK